MNGKPASAPCGRAWKTDQMKQTGQAGPLGQAGQPKLRRMLILMFAAYALFMLYLLLVRNRGGLPADPAAWRREQFNLIPFLSVREYLADLFGTDPVKTRAAVINLGGNIFLFVPFGFLIPVLFAKFRSPSRVLLLMAAVMTAVEILQLLTCRGHCDVDDLILNLAGVAAGVLLLSAITRIRNKKRWGSLFTFTI